jgi:hypothetical protein
MADDVVLTQAAIDAMLPQTGGKSTSEEKTKDAVSERQPPPKAVAVSKAEIEQLKTKPVPQQPAPPSKPLQSTLHPKTSQPVPRAQKTKRGVSHPNETEILRTAVRDLTNRLTKMEMVLAEAQRIKGTTMNQMFLCDSCNSQGLVAFSAKCTKCGKQTWWGWWPKNNTDNNSNR